MNMKRFLLGAMVASAMTFATSALAKWDNVGSTYAAGAYLGLSIGYADTNWCDTDDYMHKFGYTTSSIDDGCYGGRVFAGYDFNEHFAAEVGYTYIKDGIDYSFGSNNHNLAGCLGYRIYDALLKMRVYLDCGFNVYTKLGVAYVEACDAYKLCYPSSKHDPSNTNVMFGAGFGYCLTPNWIATADWTHYRGSDDLSCFVADVNMFSLGIAYKFAC